jgi:hypothetical protein
MYRVTDVKGWVGGAGSEQQSTAGCWIDVDVLALLIVGTQYTLHEIIGLNPIKQGALCQKLWVGKWSQKVG